MKNNYYKTTCKWSSLDVKLILQQWLQIIDYNLLGIKLSLLLDNSASLKNMPSYYVLSNSQNNGSFHNWCHSLFQNLDKDTFPGQEVVKLAKFREKKILIEIEVYTVVVKY